MRRPKDEGTVTPQSACSVRDESLDLWILEKLTLTIVLRIFELTILADCSVSLLVFVWGFRKARATVTSYEATTGTELYRIPGLPHATRV